jgi:diguanylate cyclase (GGDEF)-like protein
VAVALAAICLPFYVAWSGTGYADPAFSQRNFAVLAVALAIQTALSAWVLMNGDEEATRLPRIAMSGFLLLYSSMEVALLILTLWHSPTLAAVMDSFGTGFFLLISSATPVAFIWLLNARLLDDLQRQSILDPLTQLLNRRGLRKFSERELPRYERSGRGFALAIADVDHFKSLNDTHGHTAGDAILREVAAMLQDLVRRGDAVARIGGEEFVIFLPETDPTHAMTLVERLRQTIAEHAFAIGEATVRVTVSFGVTASCGRENLMLDGLVKEADTSLYAAKQSGRNCSRLYELSLVAAERP